MKLMKMHTDGRKGVLINSMGVASCGISMILVGNITYAMTTSFGMTGTMVGLILLCSRIFDGITDIIAGLIIDKCNFKLGKARPFDLVNVPMWIFLILCFEIPNLSMVGKGIYLFAMYNLCQSVCYTFVSVACPVRMKHTYVEDVRSKVVAVCAVMTAVFSTVAGVIAPILIAIFEKQPHGWTIIATIFAIPALLMSLLQFFRLPEMDPDETAQEAGSGNQAKRKVSVLESAKALFQNPYLICLVLMVLANTLSMSISGTVGTYYFKYNMGQLELASVIGLFSVVGYLFLIAMPAMTKRIGNRKTVMVAFAMIFAGNMLKLLMPLNLVWLIVCTIISQIGIALSASARDLVMIDAMRYGTLKTGVDGEGLYASVRGFADKLANGLGPFMIGILLDFTHFDGNADVQPASANNAILMLFTVIPAVVAGIAFLAMYFCRMEEDIKKMEQAKQKSVQ